jgi:hypothetical protein
MCPAERPGVLVAGTVRGRRVSLDLTSCSGCGQTQSVADDITTLLTVHP